MQRTMVRLRGRDTLEAALAEPTYMRGPQGQTVEAADSVLDFYERRGFRRITSEELYRETSAAAERKHADEAERAALAR